jgi:hypothetical protein
LSFTGLHFDPADGGDIILRKVGLSPSCMTLLVTLRAVGFMYGRYWVQISFCVFPQFLQARDWMILQISPGPPPSTSLSFHYSLIILPFNAVSYDLLAEPCSTVVQRRFGGMYCLHFQSRRVSRQRISTGLHGVTSNNNQAIWSIAASTELPGAD